MMPPESHSRTTSHIHAFMSQELPDDITPSDPSSETPELPPDSQPQIDLTSDHFFMGEALRQAVKAYSVGEVPVGAVVVRKGRIIARAFNQVETLKDATAHAEMLALTAAQSIAGDWRLTDCTLYVTKEPCPMCAGALVHCRLERVVFGAPDAKGGAAGGALNLLQFPGLNHQCTITHGVRLEECRGLLKTFFQEQRAANKSGSKSMDSANPGPASRNDQST
jgi:tRNA(adenine34) deaminase